LARGLLRLLRSLLRFPLCLPRSLLGRQLRLARFFSMCCFLTLYFLTHCICSPRLFGSRRRKGRLRRFGFFLAVPLLFFYGLFGTQPRPLSCLRARSREIPVFCAM
jgi:hypothetical protein